MNGETGYAARRGDSRRSFIGRMGRGETLRGGTIRQEMGHSESTPLIGADAIRPYSGDDLTGYGTFSIYGSHGGLKP